MRADGLDSALRTRIGVAASSGFRAAARCVVAAHPGNEVVHGEVRVSGVRSSDGQRRLAGGDRLTS